MKNILSVEIKKALTSKIFLLLLCLSILITIFNALYVVQAYKEEANNFIKFEEEFNVEYNKDQRRSTVYNNWIGGEDVTLAFSIYFFIIPLFALMAYGWSYCNEMLSGYEKNIVIKVGREKYYLSKYIANFIAGGLMVALPLLINFLMVACFIPALTPDVSYNMYYTIYYQHVWAKYFFTKPVLFIVLYLILDFVMGGLFASLTLVFAYITKNKYATVIVPFLIILGIHYLRTLLYWKVYVQISPIYILHSTAIENPNVWYVILPMVVILFLVSFIPTLIRMKKHEIY